MADKDGFVEREKQLQEFRIKSEEYKSSKRLNRQLQEANREQEIAIRKFLVNADERFRKLAQINMKLLQNDRLNFVVTQNEGSAFSSYSSVMVGHVYPNGYLYLNSVKTNLVLHSIQSNLYAKSYIGNVDFFGDAEVEANEVGFKLFNVSIPGRYDGSISSHGLVCMEPKEMEIEPGGNLNVGRVLTDPFKAVERNRKLFLNNRNEMKEVVLLYRKSLLQ